MDGIVEVSRNPFVVCLIIIVTLVIVKICYNTNKRTKEKVINLIRYGSSCNREIHLGNSKIEEVKDDKITYLGIKTAGVESPRENFKEIIYFKYGNTVLGIKDNPELYFLAKSKKYNDILSCKVKIIIKAGIVLSQKVVSINGIEL